MHSMSHRLLAMSCRMVSNLDSFLPAWWAHSARSPRQAGSSAVFGLVGLGHYSTRHTPSGVRAYARSARRAKPHDPPTHAHTHHHTHDARGERGSSRGQQGIACIALS